MANSKTFSTLGIFWNISSFMPKNDIWKIFEKSYFSFTQKGERHFLIEGVVWRCWSIYEEMLTTP